MPDFTQLLRRPAFEAKAPQTLPAGDYEGVIAGWEPGESSQKKTPFIRYMIKLLEWPEAVSEDDRTDIDLTKRQVRKEFYLNPGDKDSFFQLDQFLRSCGLEGEGKSYDELVSMVVGKYVIASVKQRMQPNSDELRNEVGLLVGK